LPECFELFWTIILNFNISLAVILYPGPGLCPPRGDDHLPWNGKDRSFSLLTGHKEEQHPLEGHSPAYSSYIRFYENCIGHRMPKPAINNSGWRIDIYFVCPS